MPYHGVQNTPCEWAYTSPPRYYDPENDVTLDVEITDPAGRTQRVPAFWAGEHTWRVRYAPHAPGAYRLRSICSDAENPALHDVEGALEASPYEGANPLLRHGPLRMAENRRHLEHRDGTPFLWLGDTWWMGLCRRLPWPDGFRELAADRVSKGFSVVQIVAGLYPDMPALDARGANEAGFPWDRAFRHTNPAYFGMADLRIAHLVASGLVPCIVGSWGYYLTQLGPEVLRRHWRTIIARWGAYPVVWCIAGEALMPYYVNRPDGEDLRRLQEDLRAQWSALVRDVRAMDPYGHPITIHPTRYGREQLDDPALLDLEMLQTGHSGYPTLSTTVSMVEESLFREPRLPVLVGEANYEGIMGGSGPDVQRFLVWSTLLSGAAGYTYGANGIWQVNTQEVPYGPSPHGAAWGHTPWDVAARLPGSAQAGLARRLLSRYPWWRFRPHPEWVEPHHTADQRIAPYAAGVPGEVRVVYLPASHAFAALHGNVALCGLEPGEPYRAVLFDPLTGETIDVGALAGDEGGGAPFPRPPVLQDWVLALERK
jgi:hypothetical protein